MIHHYDLLSIRKDLCTAHGVRALRSLHQAICAALALLTRDGAVVAPAKVTPIVANTGPMPPMRQNLFVTHVVRHVARIRRVDDRRRRGLRRRLRSRGRGRRVGEVVGVICQRLVGFQFPVAYWVFVRSRCCGAHENGHALGIRVAVLLFEQVWASTAAVQAVYELAGCAVDYKTVGIVLCPIWEKAFASVVEH